MFVKVIVLYSCGLAALAMAGQLLTGTPLDADHLLQDAVKHQFSFHGEMFSGALSFLFQWFVEKANYVVNLTFETFSPLLFASGCMSW